MADFKFSCPHCAISIEADELWCGHEIQCPSCKKEFVVSPKPAEPPHAALASAAPSQAKLSIGQSQAQRSAAPPPTPPQVVLLQHKLNQAKAGQKSGAMKWVTIGVTVIVLGAAGFFAYGPIKEWLAKRAEAAKQASAPPPVTNAAPVEPPPPPKELPLLPAVWTLDVDKAKIPEGKANGTISGTNFIVEAAICTPQVLTLYQGAAASPERQILVYINLKAGESPTGRVWTVSQDKRGNDVPKVRKLWKTNPKYAPQSKSFAYGYAMKLELGEGVSNTIPGKIFLALPDPEQSVVAGVFTAMTALATATAAPAPAPVVAPAPPPPAESPAFQKRPGEKR
jgi:hypothetical protein